MLNGQQMYADDEL